MKKGFTLIELLAVIVILAIIALIATPIVLNIINDARESSTLRSADFYLDAVEYTIADAVLNKGGITNDTYYIMPDGNLCRVELTQKKECPETDGKSNILEVEVNGEKPTGGYITIENGNIKDISIDLNNKTIVKNEKGELESKLAPGLYDENDNLLISWEELTSLEYKTITYETTIDLDINTGEGIYGIKTSPILYVDENRVLKSTYYSTTYYNYGNYSAQYLAGKLVIDESVTKIGEDAFSYCLDLTSITIPDSVTSIEGHAFRGSGLTSITIPSSVTSIKYGAFDECASLTTINYKGTEEEWNSITKGTNWDKDTPSDKVINYIYTG